jgi:hypothetical protein
VDLIYLPSSAAISKVDEKFDERAQIDAQLNENVEIDK